MCRRGTNAHAHRLDFQYKDFGDVFPIIKKRLLLVKFSILHCGKYIFFTIFYTSCGYETL
jgi:hypothetical protein